LNQISTPQCTATTYFDVDSSLLSNEMRNELEIMLATYRKLWSEADAQAAADAFASPEDTAQHNQTLTDARATSVKQAVIDAFGPDLCIQQLLARGHGERPATDKNVGGLLDPETAPPGSEVRIQREMREAYPQWRRVDLWAVGWLLLRMKPM
jgi:outer membrane protein OmpA-like peptidoglycan-associated protein